ncbi:tRNA (guanosine(46)-N7)-methyltransferase TrmB [Streptomyces sp. MST-110588]|uniref:tRNA (guanosine(46)-N7)-methyltransferase TrmB n=1 Tax=Streptomyces sp. MST-110588 TaxID=2833628 RepID=UPI001F5DCF38|nr:tRNA (guanosine(46)-N7)-methyltransferase TrmB [Streptomyces sp. MST-110588]UNO41197.1 tRNA (guanosine(46)-N7)-methyltransferase TrmB [Streptomyces sp. MST-110588]
MSENSATPAEPAASTGATARTAPTAPTEPAESAGPAESAARGPRPEPMFPDGTGPAADPAGSHHERRIRSFQPRRSRVSPGQAAAIRRRWSEWGLDIDGLSRIDLGKLFDGRPVVLEIGFGMGEATAQMAADDPDTGILACDVHTPGQGNLLGLAERNGLSNIRVANGDAIILLREMLAPGSLAGLRVFFPDPWPKKRHHKRRLIQPDFISLASTRLAPGALVHCATDWEPYAEQMLEVLSAEPTLENLYPDYAPRPDFRPLTKFEGQGLDKGHVVHDLLFRRRPA